MVLPLAYLLVHVRVTLRHLHQLLTKVELDLAESGGSVQHLPYHRFHYYVLVFLALRQRILQPYIVAT